MSQVKQLMHKADRLIELAPKYVMHPGRLRHVARGVHPGLLPMLDQPWLRAVNPTTVLDVGANTGQFSQTAHAVFPEAMVYAFEPLPVCLAQLSERMKGIDRFRAFPVAVGSEDSVVTIHQSDSSPSSSILTMTNAHTNAFPWTEGSQDIEVSLRRLDSFLPELTLVPPVLLKVDVQGYSLQVLRGATDTLKQCDLVVIETSVVALYEGESTFDEVYMYMREGGFVFAGALDQLMHPETNEVLQVDAMFRRSS